MRYIYTVRQKKRYNQNQCYFIQVVMLRNYVEIHQQNLYRVDHVLMKSQTVCSGITKLAVIKANI